MARKKPITTEDVLEICNGKLICGNLDTVFEDFCKDTRELKPGDVYVGIKGENHDGSEYYNKALEMGAKACILQNILIPDNIKERYADRTIIVVENTIRALQKLAAYKREMYDIPVIAVTGSVGKTSTKDIIASVMSQEYNVLKTEGNYNNQLGVPLTILRLKDHSAMVIELGMNQLGEISTLSQIAKPTVAVITNVGTAHIGNLGSRQNILKAKLEILEGLKSDGELVINNDNDLLHNWALTSNGGYDVVTFGIDNISNVMPRNVELQEDKSIYNIEVKGVMYKVSIQTPGIHFVSNSLCAIAVGRIFGMDMQTIIAGIENYELTKRRMEIIKLPNNVILVNDCYNANYDSMKASIEYLSSLSNSKKITVLGDMLELGDFSESLHRKVGEVVVQNNIDELITVGNEAKYIADQAKLKGLNVNNIHTFDNNQDAIDKLKELMENGDVAILVKASNGMKFQEIVDAVNK